MTANRREGQSRASPTEAWLGDDVSLTIDEDKRWLDAATHRSRTFHSPLNQNITAIAVCSNSILGLLSSQSTNTI